MDGIEVLFVAGFGPIVDEAAASRKLYQEALGLPLEPMGEGTDYYATDKLDGVKHFGLWPLSGAAQSCFGRPDWPADLPRPQAGIEFEVGDIVSATAALKAKGYTLLVEAREEPWGQTVTRLLSPEGMLVGLTVTPWMRG
jgi:catechol 2,3-dioxygenase-like lactoylglutathione lyase family enzyme